MQSVMYIYDRDSLYVIFFFNGKPVFDHHKVLICLKGFRKCKSSLRELALWEENSFWICNK